MRSSPVEKFVTSRKTMVLRCLLWNKKFVLKVSSYLLELSESSAVLVDVGEGTYGQLRALLEEEETHKVRWKTSFFQV